MSRRVAKNTPSLVLVGSQTEPAPVDQPENAGIAEAIKKENRRAKRRAWAFSSRAQLCIFWHGRPGVWCAAPCR